MSAPQVKDLLGAPDLRELKGEKETWHYSQEGGLQTVFESGKLVEFGRDEPQKQMVIGTPAPTPPLPVHILKIGDECHKDVECQSDNCHFHLCSGKNNCSVPVGKTCGTDSDCCEGRCDFQKCRIR